MDPFQQIYVGQISMHDTPLPLHSCTETHLLIACQLYVILVLSILICLEAVSEYYYNNIVNVHTLFYVGTI